MSPGRTPAVRAARLLRWYPRSWRSRYGAEFAELLTSEIEERPRSAARTLDVIRGGLTARLTAAGLAGCPLSAGSGPVTRQLHYRQASASLGSLGGLLALFLTVAAALWSGLLIDEQQEPPLAAAATAALPATRVLSVAMLVLLALAAAAVLPALASLAARFLAGGRTARRGLRAPAAALLAGGVFLFTGGRHFANGWPGTGGHGSFVPAGLAAFEWASSLSVSAYWAHPGRFLALFPGPEVAWMAVSPVVLAVTVAAAVVLVRRAGLPPRVLAVEIMLAQAACAVMAVVLTAAACWVATSGPGLVGGRGPLPFHAGLIDLAGVALLALVLPAAAQAARLARRELRLATEPQ